MKRLEYGKRKVDSLSQQNCPVYGGQAVLEGVMFAGQSVHVTAVRRKTTNEISFFEVPKQEKRWVNRLKRIPFIRGLVGIIEASAKGAQHFNFAMEVFVDEEEKLEDEKAAAAGKPIEKKAEKKESGFSLSMILGVAVVGVLSFIFGKLFFTVVPAMIEQLLFDNRFKYQYVHNMIEGLIKIIFLVVYILLISMTPPIKRLFQYHGAEHKVITAYEAGEELTVRNVQKYSTLHYRCGSSFIILTVLIGVIIYSFVQYDSMWERIYQRILLLPVVIGVSYEALRFTNNLKDIPVLRYLGYPGLWLQLLTTKQPDDAQVEVAIASFNRMREIDMDQFKK